MCGLDALTGALPAATSGRFGAGPALGRRRPGGVPRRLRPGRAAGPSTAIWATPAAPESLFERIDAALRGPLSDRSLLTVFGQYNDPLRFQPKWKALFPHARQQIVPKGNHFPMCDAPNEVAAWIREWHRDAVALKRTR